MSILINSLIDGAILSLLTSLWLIITFWVNPRIFLHDYPTKIQEKVPQNTPAEWKLSYVFGVPFILLLLFGSFFSTHSLKEQGNAQILTLWLNAAGVLWVFNLVDWLILDRFIYCALTPRFIVIPGSEGTAEYKDYQFHFHGFFSRNSLFDPWRVGHCRDCIFHMKGISF
jgi:hypothetical protein